MAQQVWTIGHSNRALELFLEMLASQQVEAIADVRRFPGSRRYPQFGLEALQQSLETAGIEYRHFPELGGRRKSSPESSPNTGWRVAAFQAYADYIQTSEFAAAFDELQQLAKGKRTAMMCAEALPWQCHRRLLADRFVVLGWEVLDIMAVGQTRSHELPSFAHVQNGELTYPGEELLF